MANWRHKLEIGDIFHDEKMSIEEKGKQVAARIRTSTLKRHEDALDIADQFEAVEDVEEFDGCLEELYNLGDTELPPFGWPPNRLAWIDTSRPRLSEVMREAIAIMEEPPERVGGE